MDFKRNETADKIVEAINAAREELKNYSDMPEHYSTIYKYPNMDAKGYFSEIDMDIAARLRKCDTYAQRKTIYQQAMYNHVRQEVETKADGLKKQVQEIAKEHRVLTRAARLCENPEAKRAILAKAEALKESEAVKDYNLLIAGLEAYSGAGPSVMEGKTVAAYDRLLGYVTNGDTDYFEAVTADGIYRERPDQININMRSMDEFCAQFMESHPGAKEKTEEELNELGPQYELFKKTVSNYAKDVMEDTLNSCFATMDERLDLVMIDGQTLREMIEEKDKKEGRKEERTPEQLNELSCNILTAALRSDARVEAFMKEADSITGKKFYGEPVPIVAKQPEERVTMSFWEKFLALFGFHKEKAQKYKKQQTIDRKMEECKQRVKEKMERPLTKEENKAGKKPVSFSDPMTIEQKERMKIAREIAKENCDSFVRDVRIIERTHGESLKLTYSFFPEEAKERKAVKIEGKADKLERDKPLYNCVTMMLQRGIPYEEVLDPTKHTKLRHEIGQQLKEKFPTMSNDEYDKLHLDGMHLWAEKLDDFAKKMSKEIKSVKDLGEKIPELYMGTLCAQVLGMDDFKDKEKAIAACGGKEKFDPLRSKLESAANIYNIGTTLRSSLKKYYTVLKGEHVNIAKILSDNVQKVSIIMGLQDENPSFNPKLDAMDTYNINGLLEFHTVSDSLQQKADNMDREFLNDWLSNGAENQAHVELEILDERIPIPHKLGYVDKGDMDVRVNVIVNGKNLINFKDPEKQKTTQEKEEIEKQEDELDGFER